tara:strand:+ start:417 stop:734 length:318 start_codon:yes stop_codon:yes gene_type:complete
MTLPRDFTKQEKIVQQCLDITGLRYDNQVEIGKYTVDFYIDELKMVIEADGVYGHLRKRDKLRDKQLQETGVEYIVHIKSHTQKGVAKEIWQALNKLEQSVTDEA